jgi:hypothetical protein
MRKSELLRALEPYNDDQYVYVRLHSKAYPDGAQVIIQGIKPTPPWHDAEEDQSNWLVGLTAHDGNSPLGEKNETAGLSDDAWARCGCNCGNGCCRAGTDDSCATGDEAHDRA